MVERGTNRRELGLLAGALFASVPMVPLVASWSYAEAPFWLLITSCWGCLLRWMSTRRKILLVVAALLATAAAYTKNEGVLLGGIAAAWLCVMAGRDRFWSVALFLGIFALGYSPWVVWTRFVMAFGSHATVGLHLDLETLSRAGQRLPTALSAIFTMWRDVKQWNIVLWITLVFSFIGLFRREKWVFFFMPFAALIGYLVIIVFHQAEIYWQVGTAWNRLTIHALPLLIVAMVHQWAPYLESGFFGKLGESSSLIGKR
jgi:hypothetical protein